MPYKDIEKRKEVRRKYKEKNKEAIREKAKEYTLRNRERIREKNLEKYYEQKKFIYDYYGYRCNCCNELNPRFLTIDHVENDGYKHRGVGSRIYQIIIKDMTNNGAHRYQILCYNCNCAKRLNDGVCPHKDIN